MAEAKADSSVKASAAARLHAMFTEHYDFIWRSLRRLGLRDDHADDAAQRVFIVASQKIDSIDAASEKSFLFGTALRISSDLRRSAPYRRDQTHEEIGDDLQAPRKDQPDELVDQLRARQLLDEVLDAMELDLRTVFVLYELEEMTTQEIALLLSIPHGTAQSRLRRAREEFQTRVTARQTQAASATAAKPKRMSGGRGGRIGQGHGNGSGR